MDKLQHVLQTLFGPQRVQINEPLTQYISSLTFDAPLFLIINDPSELVQAIRTARKYEVPFQLLDRDTEEIGKKSSFDGLVIKDNARRFDVLARKGKIQSRQLITDYALIEAESGVPFSQLVRFTIEESLGGLEYGLGTAGTVSKVLATEEEIVNHFQSQRVIQSVTILTPKNEKIEISFDEVKKDLIVLSIIFKLQGEDKKILWLKGQKAAESRGITDYSTI